jgi:hypothetical protein
MLEPKMSDSYRHSAAFRSPPGFVRDSRRWILVAGLVLAALELTFCASLVLAKDDPPMGMVAVSAGDVVVLVEPVSGAQKSISTGPVAWLFPAPGGTLFAPDLVHGKTTVINLLSLATETPIDGVTMPHFGIRSDRYVALTKHILILSYPERALMNRIDVGFEHPWQVEVHAEDSVLVVLERLPDGGENATLSIVKLDEGKLVYRRPLSSDIRHFSFSPTLGVIALADPDAGRVLLADPSTLATAAEFKVPGRPVDLAFVEGGSTLAVAIERDDGGGELAIWKIKPDNKDTLQRKKEWTVLLAGAPVRLASSPDYRHVVVGLKTKELQVVRIEKQEVVALVKLPDVPRDVVWCDPLREGPLIPDWSDDDPTTLDLSGP